MFTPSLAWIVVFTSVTSLGVFAFLRWSKGEVPLWAAGSICIGGIVVMGGLTVPYIIYGKGGIAEFVIAMLLFIGLLVVLSRLLAHSVGALSSQSLYGSSLSSTGATYSTTAARLASRGKIDEAITEYRLYLLEDPGNPNPLFTAAGLAEHHGRHIAALECYAEIRDRFASDLDVWASATLREANLRKNVMDDMDTAMALYHEILTRAPDSSAAAHAEKSLPTLRQSECQDSPQTH